MNNLSNLEKIIKSIANTSSKKEKQSILALHKEDTLFRDILNHLFNPYIKTNIAKKKLSKNLKVVEGWIPIKDIHHYMQFLSNSTGKDIEIASVQDYISQNEEARWLLESMATKTIKIGATGSTINKAFECEFIPMFEPMLAEKYIEMKTVTVKGKSEKKLYEHWKRYVGKRVIATKKLDGNRCLIFVKDDGVELYSREGHLLKGFGELEEAFASFPKRMVYDGEILSINNEGLDSLELYNKTSSAMRSKGEKKDMEFHAFDILPIEEFKKGFFDVRCEERKTTISKIINKYNHKLIKYVEPLYVGEFDKKIIDDLADKAKANKEEGIMVQLADSGYNCKRCFDILKCKSMASADILCLDVYRGKSDSTENTLGGLVLDFKGNRVNVGSGIREELRKKIWADPSVAIGKIIEIQYFEEFIDKDTGELDLRFASFKDIRHDKTEPSYY
jgi:DNA ligase 1